MAMAPVATQMIQVSGIDTEVRTAGAGPALLFLHTGHGLDSDDRVLSHLGEHFSVRAPSHPGFGRTALPGHYRSIDDLAYFYLDLIEQQDWRDMIVVGVSFGAWLAAEIAIKNTSRIRALVLADAVGAKFGAPMQREIADLFSVPLYELPELLHEAAAQKRIEYETMSDDLLERLARNHESFALYSWSPTLHDPKLVSRLHRINRPTRLLWGAADRVVSADYGRQFAAAIPGAGFELIEGAGHYSHEDQPEAFAAAVTQFARSQA